MENSGTRHPAEGGVSVGSGQYGDEVKVMTIIRVSHEDQLRGYGPEVQWTDDVLPNARFLGVIVDERHRRVIQESATGWDRPRFEAAVEETLQLHRASQIGGVFFPRVDRETRFLFGSISLLVTVLKQGMKVYFGRERFRLDPEDPESVEKYLRKVQEGNAYTQALKVNTSKARRKRAENDHRMPSGGGTWFHEYHPYRKASGLLPTIMSGKHTLRPERALIGRRWATWILEKGLSLGECVRLTEKQFGVKVSRETLWRSLRDPSAIGKFYAYKARTVASPTGQHVVRNPESEWLLVHEDPSLAVLTREEFDAIREKFRDNKEKSFRNTHRWYPPLRKLITHSCGRAMTGCYKGNDPWYRCWRCRAWLPARPLWQAIQARVRAILLDPALVLSVLKGREDNRQIVARLEDALRDIRRRLKELDQAETEAIRIRVYLGGQLSGPAQGHTLEKLAAELQRIADQREAQQREEASLRKQIEGLQLTAIDEAGLRRFCESARQNLEAWDDGQWRVVLEALRMKIAAGNTDVTVQLAVPMVRGEADVIVSQGSRRVSRYFEMTSMSQASSEPKYAVVWPLGRQAHKPLRVRGPIADLRGKTVGQLWDRLFRGNEIFAVIREKLQERYPDIKFVSYDVFGNIQGPDEPEVIAALPELLRKHGCDVVISGIGA